MHNPNEKEGEKEMKRKAPNRKEKPLFCFKVCNLFNRLPVKMISTVDGVFDYYWCVLKESVRGCVPNISRRVNTLNLLYLYPWLISCTILKK